MVRGVCLVTLIAVVLLVGCSVEAEYTVKITGSDRYEIHGNYTVVDAAGGSTSKSFEARIPYEFTVKGASVSVFCQLVTPNTGGLVIQVYKGNKLLKESSASGMYAVVTVATR